VLPPCWRSWAAQTLARRGASDRPESIASHLDARGSGDKVGSGTRLTGDRLNHDVNRFRRGAHGGVWAEDLDVGSRQRCDPPDGKLELLTSR
jgi:hypothetical protein